jgi:hypothetical protein
VSRRHFLFFACVVLLSGNSLAGPNLVDYPSRHPNRAQAIGVGNDFGLADYPSEAPYLVVPRNKAPMLYAALAQAWSLNQPVSLQVESFLIHPSYTYLAKRETPTGEVLSLWFKTTDARVMFYETKQHFAYVVGLFELARSTKSLVRFRYPQVYEAKVGQSESGACWSLAREEDRPQIDLIPIGAS